MTQPLENTISNDQLIWNKLLSSKRLDELLGTSRAIPPKLLSSALGDPRNPFEKDCDRIIYSYPFRRLQDKTQVIPFPAHDFVHTRLTHSLEVSTVGRSFGKMLENYLIEKRNLKINLGEIPSIVTATCLAHDIGNPPFGHSGEDSISEYFKYGNAGELVLNVEYRKPNINKIGQVEEYEYINYESECKISDLQAFEGNAMGFRILTTNPKDSMNLTCATLAAFTKYPRGSYIGNDLDYKLVHEEMRASQKKFGFFYTERDIFKLIAEEVGLVKLVSDQHIWARHPLSFLMEAADDICYSIIDFEDGCRQKRISFSCTNRCTIKDCLIEKTGEDVIIGIASLHNRFDKEFYDSLNDSTSKISYLRGLTIGVLTTECFAVFEKNYEEILNGQFDSSLINCIDKNIRDKMNEMKALVKAGVYQSRDVLETEATGFEVIGGLIEAFVSVTDMCLDCSFGDQPKKALKIFDLIPNEYKPTSDEEKYLQLLKITDYIAGMTDSYAINLYRKIKGIQLPH